MFAGIHSNTSHREMKKKLTTWSSAAGCQFWECDRVSSSPGLCSDLQSAEICELSAVINTSLSDFKEINQTAAPERGSDSHVTFSQLTSDPEAVEESSWERPGLRAIIVLFVSVHFLQ